MDRIEEAQRLLGKPELTSEEVEQVRTLLDGVPAELQGLADTLHEALEIKAGGRQRLVWEDGA